MHPNDNNGWEQWSKHILIELKRLNTNDENLEEKINKVLIEIAMLKVKSGIWGLMGGAIPVFIILIIDGIKG